MGVKERRERERHEMRRAILGAASEIASREGWQAVTIRRVAEKIEYSPPTIYEYFESKEEIVIELLRDGFRRLLAEMRAAREAHADPEEALVAMALAYWEFAWKQPALYQGMNGLGLEGADLSAGHGPAAMHGRAHHAAGIRGHPAPDAAGRDGPDRDPTGRALPAGLDDGTPDRCLEAHRQIYRRRKPDLTDEPWPEGAEIFLTVRDALERALGTPEEAVEWVSWKVVVLWSTVSGLVSLVMRGLIPDGRERGSALVGQTVRDLLAAWRAQEAR